MQHPRERWSRRTFLSYLGGAVALTPAAAFLAACRPGDPMVDEAPVPLARRDRPVELPLDPDNPAIADGMPPESAPLRVLGWPLYVRPSILAAFEQRYHTKIEWTNFDTMNEALARLRSSTEQFDLFFPTPDVLGLLARSGKLRPLNHSYLPNLQRHVWEEFRSPFYDVGARYTVPYMVWTTGIAWRNDRIAGPRDLPDPYSIFWDTRFRGHVHLLSEPHEVISMTLLRNGVLDVNSEDPATIDAARDDLLDLVDAVAPSFDHLDYEDLYSGQALVHQSWSGNIGFADAYAPRPQDVRELSYWWPAEDSSGHPGVVSSDTFAVLQTAQSPVLAHLFVNHLLEPDVALQNVDYEGATQPIKELSPDRVMREGLLPPNLASVPVSQEEFARGLPLLELSPQADVLWQSAWREVTGAQARTAAIP